MGGGFEGGEQLGQNEQQHVHAAAPIIPFLTDSTGNGMLRHHHEKGQGMGQQSKNTPLSVEVAWRVKQEYERKDQLGRRLFSMRQVAAMFGISETSVLRIVTNTGKFANMHNKPLPEVIPEGEMDRAAASSLQRLQGLIAAEKAEKAPGTNRADRMLNELSVPVSEEVKARARMFLDTEPVSLTNEEKKDERAGEAGPVNPLDE